MTEVTLVGAGGPVPGIVNHGVPFLADVFRTARFCTATRPPVSVPR